MVGVALSYIDLPDWTPAFAGEEQEVEEERGVGKERSAACSIISVWR
jgi:hypothetical protein